MKKESYGKVILLFLINELTSLRVVKVLADRKINVGENIYFDQDNYLKVIEQNENIFKLKFNFSQEHLFSLLNKYGTMPIPPYLKKFIISRRITGKISNYFCQDRWLFCRSNTSYILPMRF